MKEVVALWFSDIEGSTRVMLRTGDAYEEILDRHRQIVRASFVAFDAEERGTEGDSFFAVFRTAGAAAGAAVAVQRALAAEPWSEPGLVAIRIGLHLGEVRRSEGDLTGLAVHVAARVMSAGHGGQIVATRMIKDHLDGSVEVLDLGEHSLKDIPEPVTLYQLVAEDLARDFPPLRTATRRRHTSLPVTTTSFVGRQHELTTAVRLLTQSRLLTFVGPPGCGKTRLATELAGHAGDDYEFAVFVDLVTVERPRRVGPAIALAAGVAGTGDPVAATAAMIGEGSALLVLDNCEHLLSAVGASVDALIGRCPALRVLATSQVPLGREGETLFPMSGLATSIGDAEPARRLFLDRAAARGVEIEPRHLTDVDELVSRLDGIPLAIELAASLAPTLSPREMVGRLDRRFELLVSDAATSNARHTTLESAIEWGYGQLSEEERNFAARLAVCAGAFDMGAAEALGADLGVGSVVPNLHRLVRASWLLRTEGLVGSRYRMLESLREYSSSRLDEDGRGAARQSHAHHFLRLLRLGPLGEDLPNEAVDFAIVDEDLPNILLAIQWAISSRSDLDAAAETYLALTSYWQARPSWREPYELVEALLPVCRGVVDLSLEAELLDSKAFYEMMVGGVSAISTVEVAGDAARRSGSARARLRWLHMASQVYSNGNDARRAMQYANALVDEALDAGSNRYAAMGYFHRGLWRLETEGLAEGTADLLRSVQIAGDRAHLALLTFAHNQLAILASDAGDTAEALAHSEQAQIVAARSDHRIAELSARVTSAQVSSDRGTLRTVLDEAIAEARKLGTGGFEASLHRGAARAALADGDLKAAQHHMAVSDTLDHADHAGEITAWLIRAAILHAAGRSEDAVAGLRAALAYASAHALRGRAWRILWILAVWGEAADDAEVSDRIRAAAEHAFSSFSPPLDAEALYGTAPSGASARSLEPLDLDTAVSLATRLTP